MLITLTCPCQPVSGKNHKSAFVVKTKTGQQRAVVAKGKAIVAWTDSVVPKLARQFAAFGLPTLKGFVEITLVEYLAHPVGHRSNPDGDNVQAAVWDALQHALVIADDRLVRQWSGIRHHDPLRPRVEIEIRTLEEWEEGAIFLAQLQAKRATKARRSRR